MDGGIVSPRDFLPLEIDNQLGSGLCISGERAAFLHTEFDGEQAVL